jgi:rhamnogalacturonan endolyase
MRIHTIRYISFIKKTVVFITLIIMISGVFAQPQTESLDRGLVAVRTDSQKIYLGWRLLATDPKNIAFNVYRSGSGYLPIKLNEQPITQSTNFVDTQVSLDLGNSWFVKSVLDRTEIASSENVVLPPNPPLQPFKSIKLIGDYGANKLGIADLNGDGTYDYIIKQPAFSIDPGRQRPSPGTYKIEAYNGKTGEFMWQVDLGWNINMGIWFSPVIVYDLDSDGKAEIACKTAPYAKTPEEAFISPGGFVLEGPEYCSLLDGATGKDIDKVNWVERGNPADWGDDRGNRVNRNQLGVAYLDGKNPSLLVLRGTYTKMRIDAYNLIEKKLKQIWSWSGEDENPPLRGQGGHSLHVFDIDNDRCDEIIIGSAVIDNNGTCLWRMNMGHPDWCYLADIDPSRPGLEMAYGFETRQSSNGICLVDPRNGKILWGCDFPTTHIHDWGMVADINHAYPGMEIYGMERDGVTCWLFSAAGQLLAQNRDLGRHGPRAFYWLDSTVKVRVPFSYRSGTFPILKYENEQIGEIIGQPIAIADCLGDWREEVITVQDGYIRIYTTPIPSNHRNICLMQDPLYRMDVAVQMMGYFYPPQISYTISF